MATAAVEVGHVIVGSDGVVLRADAGFGSIMHADPTSLVGRGLLDLTAPQDRDACRDLMRMLRRSGQPYRVVKRMLRLDGSMPWVDKTVAIADFGAGTDPRASPIVVTIVPIRQPDGFGDPAHLLEMALFLRESRRAQGLMFGYQVFIGDIAWDMLLAAYIAEARGEMLTLDALVAETHAAASVVKRWIAALEREALIERESDDGHYRMTQSAHERFEAYLVDRVHKLPSDGDRG